MNERLPRERWRRLAISLFILWNAAVILFTNSQYLIPPVSVMLTLLPYARATRVMQRWALFCPEPRRHISQYFFEITFKDGTKTRWSRPASPNWGFFERQHASNWQKFDTASNHMEDHRFRADLAAWVSALFASDTNPPARIELFHHTAPVPPPSGDDFKIHEFSELTYTDQPIFQYTVATREFQR